MNTVQKQNAVSEFVRLVNAGVESWVKAGELVAAELDRDEAFIERVLAVAPEFSEETLLAFERVGRRRLHPRLLLSDKPGPAKLRGLPYDVQAKMVEQPVPLLVKSDKGWETLQVSVWNLTSSQAAQVFDKDAVRSVAAQRAWLEARAAKQPVVEFDEPFRVTGKTLVVMEPCKLTLKQLLNLCSQMQ